MTNRNNDMMDDDDVPGVGRWLPMVVVIGALAGFVSLAWYAYHAGSQSIKDEDLLVVEADKTPIKEKPLDPGGMKFPNQDKTVFETFTGNGQVPAKVERVLPAPEEPMAAESSPESKSWVGDKAPAAGAHGATEQMIGAEDKRTSAPVASSKETIAATESAAPAKIEKAAPVADKQPEKPVEAAPAPQKQAEIKQETVNVSEAKVVDVKPSAGKPVTQPAKLVEKPVAEKPVKAAATGGNSKIQLGAFRSEAEAKSAWSRAQKKGGDLLSSQSPIFVKADLGDKGIWYRIRVGGFSGNKAAKAFCDKLTAKGLACIVALGK